MAGRGKIADREFIAAIIAAIAKITVKIALLQMVSELLRRIAGKTAIARRTEIEINRSLKIGRFFDDKQKITYAIGVEFQANHLLPRRLYHGFPEKESGSCRLQTKGTGEGP